MGCVKANNTMTYSFGKKDQASARQERLRINGNGTSGLPHDLLAPSWMALRQGPRRGQKQHFISTLPSVRLAQPGSRLSQRNTWVLVPRQLPSKPPGSRRRLDLPVEDLPRRDRPAVIFCVCLVSRHNNGARKRDAGKKSLTAAIRIDCGNRCDIAWAVRPTGPAATLKSAPNCTLPPCENALTAS